MWHSAHLNFSIFHQHRWVFLYFQFRVVKNQSCQVTNWLDFISFQESRYVSGVGFKIAWNQGHLDDYLITGLAGLVLVFLNYSLAPCCGVLLCDLMQMMMMGRWDCSCSSVVTTKCCVRSLSESVILHKYSNYTNMSTHTISPANNHFTHQASLHSTLYDCCSVC